MQDTSYLTHWTMIQDALQSRPDKIPIVRQIIMEEIQQKADWLPDIKTDRIWKKLKVTRTWEAVPKDGSELRYTIVVNGSKYKRGKPSFVLA